MKMCTKEVYNDKNYHKISSLLHYLLLFISLAADPVDKFKTKCRMPVCVFFFKTKLFTPEPGSWPTHETF